MRLRLRHKVVMIYAVTLIPVSIVSAFVFIRWHDTRVDGLIGERYANAQLVGEAFSSLVRDIYSTAHVTGDTVLIHQEPGELDHELLADTAERYPLAHLSITDPSGVVVESSEPSLVGTSLADSPAVQQVLRGDRTGIEPSRRMGDHVGFALTDRLREPDGRLRGVAVAFVDVMRLPDYLPPRTVTGDANIMDSTGHVVFQTQEPALAVRMAYWGNVPVFRSALEGRATSTDSMLYPLDGRRRIAAAVPIRPYDWEAGSSIDYEIALVPFRRTVAQSLSAALFIWALSVGIGLLVVRGIVKSVRVLLAGSARLQSGDLDTPIDVRSGDELEQLGVALDTARDGLGRYVRGLSGIARAGEALNAARTVDDVRRAVNRSAIHLFGAEVVWIFVYDETQRCLRNFSWYSAKGVEEPEVCVLPGRDGDGHEVIGSRVRIIRDVHAVPDFPWRDIAETAGISSLVEIPLRTGDRVFGVFGVFAPDVERWSLEGREVALLEALGTQIAIAIENTRLYENEHRVAETLQEALLALPPRVPSIRFAHAYHSAAQAARVGGDFYDIFELEHGRLGIVMGDVSGKGLEAAVLTSVVKNGIRAQAMEPTKTPADVLRIMSDLLLKVSGAEVFVTVFFGVLDTNGGHFLYCNAGHTTGMLVRHSGPPERLPSNSALLGAFPGLEYENSEAVFSGGDFVFLYTDGLIEARGDRTFFGEERLFRSLERLAGAEPVDAVRQVVDEVVEFTDGQLSDDLAILAVECLAMREETAVQDRVEVGE